MNHSIRFGKFALLALSAATLVACGGGNDDTETTPPVPLSSECTPTTTQASGTSIYQVSDGRGWQGQRTDQQVWNESVEYQGRKVLRDRVYQRTTYTAPESMVGLIAYQMRETYFTWNSDGSRTLYGTAYSENWEENVAPPDNPLDVSETVTFDPPLVDSRFASLQPDQSVNRAVTGTVLTTKDGVTTTQILNSSQQVTYLGQETVGVPAGLPLSCKFVDTWASGDKTTSWVEKGTGLPAHVVNESDNAVVFSQSLVSTTGMK